MANRVTLIQGSDTALVLPVGDLPTGVTIDSARLMVKVDRGDADGTALIDLSITTNQSDSGLVTNNAPGPSELTFQIAGSDSAALAVGDTYFYFVKVGLSNGKTVRPPRAEGVIYVDVAGVSATV